MSPTLESYVKSGRKKLTPTAHESRLEETASHTQETRVQRVLIWDDVPFSDILYDLLVNWVDVVRGRTHSEPLAQGKIADAVGVKSLWSEGPGLVVNALPVGAFFHM